MNQTTMIEKEEVIVCSKKHSNEKVMLYSLDKKTMPLDRLLCVTCIGEINSLSQTKNFKFIRQQIQEQQDQLYDQFNEMTKTTIANINQFKDNIHQLKSDINSKLQELLGKTENWINSLLKLQYQRVQYSLLKELENFDQSLIEKQIQQFQEITSQNHSFYEKIKLFFSNNNILKDLTKCENKLKDVCSQNYLDQDSFNSARIQLIQKFEYNDNICKNHNSKILLIDLSKEMQKEQRLKCGFCDKSNAISIPLFQQRWQAYNDKKMLRLNHYKVDQGKKLSSIREIINNISTNQVKQMRELIISIDNRIFANEHLKSLQKMKQDDLAQMIDMAEELSQQEGNSKTEDEIMFTQECQSVYQVLQDQVKQMADSLTNTQKKITTELTQIINWQMTIEEPTLIVQEDQLNLKQPILQDEVKQEKWCNAVAFNNEGSIMAAGCGSEVKVWGLGNGKFKEPITTLEGHTKNITCLVFSRKMNWFGSGSADYTIRCWKDMDNNKWKSSDALKAHTNQINCILLDKNEIQLISCSRDKSIKIWRVDQQNNKLAYEYSLGKHTDQVFCISLNESETTLVSSSSDKQIIIWSREKNSQWEYKYPIVKSVDDFGSRICFINDTMIAWQQDCQGFTHIFQLENAKFVEKPKLKIELKQVGTDGIILFPCVFNKQRKMLIQKHNKFVYLISQQLDGKFKIQSEPIDSNTNSNYGGLTNDGQYLAVWNNETKQIRIYRLYI